MFIKKFISLALVVNFLLPQIAYSKASVITNMISSNEIYSSGQKTGCYIEFFTIINDTIHNTGKKVFLAGGIGLVRPDIDKKQLAGYFKINAYDLPDNYLNLAPEEWKKNIFNINYSYIKSPSFDTNGIFKAELANKTDTGKGFFLAINDIESYTNFITSFLDKDTPVTLGYNKYAKGMDVFFDLKEEAMFPDDNNSFEIFTQKFAKCNADVLEGVLGK